MALILGAIVACAIFASGCTSRPRVSIGSKAFPESWIVGEAMTRLVRERGDVDVVHRGNLGGTEIVYEALRGGSVDAYLEYTGTLSKVILAESDTPSLDELRARLSSDGVGITDSLGFEDNYALAVTAATADRLGVRSISDLARHASGLRAGLTHEFLGRADGWEGLSARYGLASTDVRGIQHDLAFDGLVAGSIDVVDVYTTDPQIARLSLRVLEDDLHFFPRYDAVIVYRLDLAQRAPRALLALRELTGRIDAQMMARADAAVALDHHTTEDAASQLLADALGARAPREGFSHRSVVRDIAKNSLSHIELVLLSLALSIVVGVPLGVVASRSRRLAAIVLGGTGILQTIPSLALLALLIPALGIGTLPAIVALFLYGLLPIVRATCTGLTTISQSLRDSARALGLTPAAELLRVELPLASRAIMTGIKTSAVINVGTATIAALIGAGGLGNPILQGIALRDTSLILQGAVPAAVLALAVELVFGMLDRVVVPRGLRVDAQTQ